MVPCDTSISRLLVCLRAHLINSRAPRHATPEQELKLKLKLKLNLKPIPLPATWRPCGRGVCALCSAASSLGRRGASNISCLFVA